MDDSDITVDESGKLELLPEGAEPPAKAPSGTDRPTPPQPDARSVRQELATLEIEREAREAAIGDLQSEAASATPPAAGALTVDEPLVRRAPDE